MAQRHAIGLAAVVLCALIAAATLKLATTSITLYVNASESKRAIEDGYWFPIDFHRIPGTSYLIAHFADDPNAYLPVPDNSRRRVMLIDVERGRRVLNVTWRNRLSNRFGFHTYLHVLLTGALNERGEPWIHFQESRVNLTHQVQWLPQSMLARLQRRDVHFYRLNARGNRRNSEIDYILRAYVGDPDRYLKYDDKTGNLLEYEYRQDVWELTREWSRNQRTRNTMVYPVLDRGYVGFLSGGIEIFLRDQPPLTRVFGLSEIHEAFPSDSWPQLGAYQPINPLMNLLRNRPTRLFRTVRTDNVDIYEVQPDAIQSRDLREIFTKAASGFGDMFPFAELQNGEILCLSPDRTAWRQFLWHSPQSIHYLQRSRTNGSPVRRFYETIHEKHLPEGEWTVSANPFDEEHLLFYRDGAFYLYNWDKENLTRLFPQ